MTKRFVLIVAAGVLAVAGLYAVHKNVGSVEAQVSNIMAHDINADPFTATDVTDLKSYVAAHMGTSANFTLTYSYNRARASAQAAQAAAAANAQVYAAAQAACSGKTDSITQAKCNANYLAAHLPSQPQSAPSAMPVLADYTYHLHAPLWTPDLAGALLLGAVLALGWFIFTGLRSGRRRRVR